MWSGEMKVGSNRSPLVSMLCVGMHCATLRVGLAGTQSIWVCITTQERGNEKERERLQFSI